jgi:hypothetical protein
VVLLVNSDRVTGLRVATYSALILFFELALIRYTAGYVRVFSFYINFVLIATFLGMGVGLLRANDAALLRWLSVPASLALFGAVWLYSHSTIAVPNDGTEYVWGIFSDAAGARRFPLSFVIASLFGLIALFFVPLGALLGREFGKLASLQAYGYDLAGSLAGILAFALLSGLRQPPVVWFALGFAAWVLASLSERSFALAVTGAGAFVVALAAVQRGPLEYWSPYYRINVVADPPVYRINVNGSLHQVVLDLDSARAAGNQTVMVDRMGYLLPYKWVGRLDTALVVGSGTGNDLALLLMRGVEHVDAVEIDPVIADLGKVLHPQKPYDDPRVHLHVDDARAFLRRSSQKYDVIIFGTLDSQTLLSGMSSVRLDNYVYTVEAFEAAQARLKDSGSLVLYHMSPQPYIGAKIYQMVGDAFNAPPGVFFGYMNLFNLIVVAGDGAPRVPPAERALLDTLQHPYDAAHDDWPYLYLRERTIPPHYFGALASVLLVAAIFIAAGAGQVVRRGFDGAMFFMGAGFLLVETKSITEMSLLFGSTWRVNLLVFASILVVVLAANALIIRRTPLGLRPLFAGLFVTLLAAYLLPASRLLFLGTLGQWVAGGLMVALPIFFAALIFSTLFKSRSDPTRALAFNLLGAIAGGVLEYASMAVGIKGLYVIAALLYAGAFAFATRTPRDGLTLDPRP